jgi:hypothetical protein
MVLDTICPVCGRYDEDGAHLFFKCKLAVQIWRLLLMDMVLFILGAKEETECVYLVSLV